MYWLLKLLGWVKEPKSPETPVATDLLSLHNDIRSRHGLQPLVEDKRLKDACIYHAEWMDKNRRMSHTGLGGSSHSDRARKFGYHGLVAENIAMCPCTDKDVVDMWYNSSGHKRNMLGNFKYIGFARVGNYWCVLFGN